MCRIRPRVTHSLATNHAESAAACHTAVMLTQQGAHCSSPGDWWWEPEQPVAGFVTDVLTHLRNPAKVVVAGSDYRRDLITGVQMRVQHMHHSKLAHSPSGPDDNTTQCDGCLRDELACCGLTKMINFVFSSVSLSMFLSIHALISS